MSSPPPATGCAAPICVLGAIAAMCDAIVMKVPAEAARAPAGLTKTTTGTSAARKRCTISSVEVISPPGVSSISTQATAPSSSARSSARSMKFSETGPMSSARREMCTAPWGVSSPQAASAIPRMIKSDQAVSRARRRRARVVLIQGA